jgi:hypothetical protein
MSKAAELAALIGSQTALSNRNFIINGAMTISQRNGTTAVTPTGSGYIVDRWTASLSQSSKLTFQQVTDAPVGFANSLKVTVASQFTPAAGDFFNIAQVIEGNNISHLELGSANAKTITLSFYAKVSVAGNYGVTLWSGNGDRHYITNVALTTSWAEYSITASGFSSGTFNTDNTQGMRVAFDLGSGSDFNNTAGTFGTGSYDINTSSSTLFVSQSAGATFQITGVQLEVGEQATPFEHRSFGDELQRCMRYYEKGYDYDTAPGTTAAYPGNLPFTVRGMDEETSGQRYMVFNLKAEKRGSPTNTYYDEQGNTGKVTTYDSGGTGTHNVSIGLVVTQSSKYGAGPGNSAIWGYGFFYECDAEL